MANDGPAFPMGGGCIRELRDWFAGQALQGFIAKGAFNQEAEDALHKAGIGTDEFEAYYAMLSYGFADAMIAWRDKGGQ